MKKENVKITFGASLLLADVVNKILFKEVVDPKGNKHLVNRSFPFRLSYRLNRNKTALERDIDIFNGRKMYLFAKYSVLDPETKNVSIKDKESFESYKKDLAALLESEAEHNVMTLEEDDIDFITEDIDISPEAMQLFIKYMTADQELLNDLCKEVKFDLPEFKEPKEKN